LYENIDARVECGRCGNFKIARLLYVTALRPNYITDEAKELLPYLSAYTRQASDRGEQVDLNPDNWKHFALACKQTPPVEKIEKLLKVAAARSRPGHTAKFDPKTDPPLVGAVDAAELGFLFRHLKQLGYGELTSHDWTFLLNGNGWQKLLDGKKPKPEDEPRAPRPNSYYVDPSRIAELKSLKNPSFDLSKLIRLCEELNICYAEGCYLAVAMLVRSVLDHVPPIFSCNNFAAVANNYGGAKSFKRSMEHLEKSSRNIADSYLHIQIRKTDTLPNETQVNFKNDLDVLLAEIGRTLK
jgi:hypothetical protein